MARTTCTLAGLALLGALLPSCSESSAAAREDFVRELREARDALGDWSSMQAAEFEQAARDALAATERRIEELQKKIADSEAADDAKAALAELKEQRDALGSKLEALGDEAADGVDAAREKIVDGFSEVQDRLDKAWSALTGG